MCVSLTVVAVCCPIRADVDSNLSVTARSYNYRHFKIMDVSWRVTIAEHGLMGG